MKKGQTTREKFCDSNKDSITLMNWSALALPEGESV
jgi:hypothetical protein